MRDNEIDDSQDDIELTGEETVDEPELEAEEATSNDKLKDLRTKLKTCEAEKRQHMDDLQRAKADFLNTRKRLEADKVRSQERAVNDHIERLLPLCDSFAMAMGNTELWETIDQKWRLGIEGIHNQLKSILDSYGVTEMNPYNEHFDPHRHEAVGTTAAETAESDTVIEVVQKGYERNGNIIRPAKVIISE